MNQDRGSSCVAAVLSFNRPELLKKCLTALEEQTLPPAEILVVDNGSHQPTIDMLAHNFPDVSLLQFPLNAGTGVGFGACIDEARKRNPDWIWIMDDDAEPDPNCLRNLIEASRRLPDSTIALAPTALSEDGRTQVLQRGTYFPVTMRQRGATHASEIERIGFSSWLGMMLRTRLLVNVEPPRVEFFVYFDDLEYSMRLAKAGPMYLVREARMYHNDQTQARRNWKIPLAEYWKLYYVARNRLLMLRLQERSPWRRAIGTVFGIYRTLRAAAGVLVFRPPGSLLRIRLLMRGLIDGLRGREGKVLDPIEWKQGLGRRT